MVLSYFSRTSYVQGEMMNSKLPRLLKPSIELYMLIVLGLALLSILIFFVFREFGIALLVTYLISGAPFILTGLIGELIAKRAERKQAPIGVWFRPDLKREKRRYGHLRSKRFYKEHRER